MPVLILPFVGAPIIPGVGVERRPEIGDEHESAPAIDRSGCQGDVIPHVDREVGPLACKHEWPADHRDSRGSCLVEVALRLVRGRDAAAGAAQNLMAPTMNGCGWRARLAQTGPLETDAIGKADIVALGILRLQQRIALPSRPPTSNCSSLSPRW